MDAARFDILARSIFKETQNQDRKWGEKQAHSPAIWNLILTEETGEFAESCLERESAEPDYTRDRLLDMANEITQVAAVAFQILESIEDEIAYRDSFP